ncbi:hypothetical protein VQ056_25845 [Paenibacillus sp. JTLBN-2024]
MLQFNNIISFEALKYVWPMLLILLGVEVVIANIVHSEEGSVSADSASRS